MKGRRRGGREKRECACAYVNVNEFECKCKHACMRASVHASVRAFVRVMDNVRTLRSDSNPRTVPFCTVVRGGQIFCLANCETNNLTLSFVEVDWCFNQAFIG